MAKDRLTLHEQLLTILGSTNVWFQPPSTVILKYPCIIYKLDGIDPKYANDKKYLSMKRYLITVVDRNPDTIIHEKVLELPYSDFETTFAKDNLNHYICSLYW